jgi:hypothetical protein
MRFILGLAIGFGAGFAGAVLFAPDLRRETEGGPAALDADDSIGGAFRRTLRSAQDQVHEALDEAKKAQAEKEAEMRARYERKVGHESFQGEVAAKVEEQAKKAKGKKDK